MEYCMVLYETPIKLCATTVYKNCFHNIEISKHFKSVIPSPLYILCYDPHDFLRLE